MIYDVSDEEMSSLTQSILTRYGIDFTCYEPKSLRRRIIRVLNRFEFQSVFQLWSAFLKDPAFIQTFMNEVSVGMTSMFRDPVMWKALKVRLKASPSMRNINIWHAGCSTGEEVYSMAILLKETHLLDRAKALATDFNRSALEEAQSGVYHKIKMIENETNYKEFNPFHSFSDYYASDGKNAIMDKSLIGHCTFDYQNLITDNFPQGFDIVLCRNVMIYFDTIAKNKLLDKFYNCLNPGGYFIIGFFDTMSHMIDESKFKMVDDGAKIFQKV